MDSPQYKYSRPPYRDVITYSREIPRIRPLLALINAGYRIAFVPDFSEIHSYVFPLDDIRQAIEDSKPDSLNRSIRNWYADKLMLEDSEFSNLLIPPYRAELNQKIRTVKRDQLLAIDELTTADQNRSISERLFADDESLSEGIKEFNKLSDFKNAASLVPLFKKYQKRFGVLLEIVAGNWQRSLARLEELWETGRLRTSEVVLEVDVEAALKESVPWAREISKARHEERGHTQFSLKSFLDGWAVEIIRRANIQALMKPGHLPVVVFVSRATEMKKAVSSKMGFEVPSLGIRCESFWGPNTYLAFRVVNRVPSKIGKLVPFEAITALERLGSIFASESGTQENLDYQQLNNRFSSVEIDTLQAIDRVNSEIENLADFNAVDVDKPLGFGFDRSEKASKELRSELIHFASQWAQFTRDKESHLSVVAECKKELINLWARMGTLEEKFIVVRGLRDFAASRLPRPDFDFINRVSYVTVKLPGHSIWLRLQSPDLIAHVRELVAEIDRNNAEAAYLELLRYVENTQQINPEIHLLWALLYLCLRRYNAVEVHLNAIGDDIESLRLEAELLKLDQGHFVEIGIRAAVERGRKLLALYEEPRLWKTLGLLLWELWLKNTDKRDDQDLAEAITLTERALRSVQEDSLFKIECQNNLSYYRIEQYDRKLVRIEILEQALADQLALQNKLYNKDQLTPDLIHTRGKLRARIAWHYEDLAQMELAADDLARAAAFPDVHRRSIYTDDLIDAQEKLSLLRDKAVS